MMDKPKGETKDATLPQTQGEKEKPGKPGQGQQAPEQG
jgi:hypothetical protein